MWVLRCVHTFDEWALPLCASSCRHSSLLPLETRAKISGMRTMLGFCSPEQIIRPEGPIVETQLPILLTLVVFGRTFTCLTLSTFVYPLEKGMATHTNIPALRILRTEGPWVAKSQTHLKNFVYKMGIINMFQVSLDAFRIWSGNYIWKSHVNLQSAKTSKIGHY